MSENKPLRQLYLTTIRLCHMQINVYNTIMVPRRMKGYFSVFARSLETVDLMENFLIASVASIVLIRVYLEMTGYPQIGGGGLHIAHMLWGGLCMLIALIISLSFLNKESRRVAAIIGGIGFGTFIDELGKFITSDNNYFFEPTFALIYIIFIGIFFMVQALIKLAGVTEKEYAMNAIEVMKEVVYYDLDEDEEKQALEYLSRSDKNNPTVRLLKRMLQDIKPHEVKKDISFMTLCKRKSKDVYLKWARSERGAKWIANFFIITSFVSFVHVALNIQTTYGFWNVGAMITTIGSFALVLVGVFFHMRKKRLKAYESYKRASTISILFTQFFQFYDQQLTALFGLAISYMMYVAIQYLIEQEKLIKLPQTYEV